MYEEQFKKLEKQKKKNDTYAMIVFICQIPFFIFVAFLEDTRLLVLSIFLILIFLNMFSSIELDLKQRTSEYIISDLSLRLGKLEKK